MKLARAWVTELRKRKEKLENEKMEDQSILDFQINEVQTYETYLKRLENDESQGSYPHLRFIELQALADVSRVDLNEWLERQMETGTEPFPSPCFTGRWEGTETQTFTDGSIIKWIVTLDLQKKQPEADDGRSYEVKGDYRSEHPETGKKFLVTVEGHVEKNSFLLSLLYKGDDFRQRGSILLQHRMCLDVEGKLEGMILGFSLVDSDIGTSPLELRRVR